MKEFNYNKINSIDNYCTCKCHIKNKLKLHVLPCCNLIGKEFLDENGNLIKKDLEKFILKNNNE